MKEPKSSNSYYLKDEFIAWLSAKAKAVNRSSSWYLNDILKQLKALDDERNNAQNP